MSAETAPSNSKTFKFSFPTCTNEEVLFNLEVPVQIPYDGCTKELVQRVINMFHIPVYLEEELNAALANFVAEETKNYHNERDEKLINQLKSGEINIDGIVKGWEKDFKEQVVEYAEQKGTSDEEVFAMAYHKLVHSPALEMILQVESSYANTIAEILKNRDEDVKKLTQSQTDEMEEQVRLLNTFTTEEDINDLACKQFEAQALAAGRWGSQLAALWQAQRAQLRAWLMEQLDLHQADAGTTPSTSPLGTCPVPEALPAAAESRLEESFTIQLGSQLKQSHNLRIVCMDAVELCRPKGLSPEASWSSGVHTALSLYSTELSACVLLCEDGPKPSDCHKELLASAHTEYHFATMEAQLNDIAERLKEPTEQRTARRLAAPPGPAPAPAAAAAAAAARTHRSRRAWQPGDVFITRHSSLPHIHVLMHLVADHTLRSGDITSRHPVILGLRNILKTACCNDITSISLPLLLNYELTEEMTAAWCMRRAELVLKCVKGFMLEAASGGGAELRSITFIAPQGLSPDVFHTLAGLLPNIFRISNPLKIKTSS